MVVMIASGWGIMAQIPFLQYLIRSFNSSSTKARRIHLFWQLDHISMPPSHTNVEEDAAAPGLSAGEHLRLEWEAVTSPEVAQNKGCRLD
jgi:hypothetical protein